MTWAWRYRGKYLWLLLWCAVAALAVARPGLTEERLVPPNASEICTPHNWIYEALGSLSAEERIPGRSPMDFAPGYRSYTRGEVADMLAAALRGALETPERLTQRERDRLSLLAVEFSRDLAYRGLQAEDLRPITEQPQDLRGTRSLCSRLDGEAVALAGQVLVSSASAASVILRSGHPERLAVARVSVPRTPRDVEDPYAGGLDEAFVRIRQPSYVLTLGAERTRWGPGYYGSFAHVDTAEPRFGVRLETDVPLPVIGHCRFINELNFGLDDSSRGFLLRRRVERSFGDLDLGYFEHGRTDFGITGYYLFLPVQAGQYVALHDPSRGSGWGAHTNQIMGVDARLAIAPSLQVYGVFSADEFGPQRLLQRLGLLDFFIWLTPGSDLFRSPPSEDKIGAVWGIYSPHLFGSDRTSARFETIYASPEYGFHPRNPGIHHIDNGQPLWPGGLQDSRFYGFEVHRRLTASSALVLDGRFLAQGFNGPALRHEAALMVQYWHQAGSDGYYSVGLGLRREGSSVRLTNGDATTPMLSLRAGVSF